MLAIFLETLNITAPVFAMLFLGVLLKRIDWINDNFIHTASSLVFNVTMPALLFLGILHADLHAALQPALLIYFSLATLVALPWPGAGRFSVARAKIAASTPRARFAATTASSAWHWRRACMAITGFPSGRFSRRW